MTDVITHTVEVYSSSLDFNHIDKLSKQLRGVERKFIKNKLLHLNPLDQLQNDVLALDESTVTISKNKGNVRCDAVYRKAKAEIIAKNDRDSNDIQDLILMRKDHPEYIKCVGVPLHVYIWSNEQMFWSDRKTYFASGCNRICDSKTR
ncbi:hypothetical protein JTB14_038096 [Gonioctena quinquepunctata]|nr:hypothetical protein JTB14_038096 [Gonioctena quinquepunctata]